MSRLSTLCVSFILLLTCTTSAKTAHYPDHQDLKDLRVLWPPQRTFRSSHLPEPGTSLCSNYPKPSANRTAFPINGAPVQFYINSTGPRFGQPLYSVHLIPSVDESNGTAGDQFDWEHDRIQHAEEFKSGFGCFGNVNISAWRKPVVGMNATLRITALLYLGGGGEVRCSDVVLTNDSLSSEAYAAHCRNGTGELSKEERGGGSRLVIGLGHLSAVFFLVVWFMAL